MQGNGEENGHRLIPLSRLREGDCGRVCAMDGKHPFCRRLLELGFAPGSQVRVRRCSPFRDPVEYEVRDTRICLRRSESRRILVRPDPAEDMPL